MKHIGTQYIETGRLILRRFELADAQAMFDNWASANSNRRRISRSVSMYCVPICFMVFSL